MMDEQEESTYWWTIGAIVQLVRTYGWVQVMRDISYIMDDGENDE